MGRDAGWHSDLPVGGTVGGLKNRKVDMKASDILHALQRHHCLPDWVTVPELRAGSGYGKRSEQRIDLWVMNALPSQYLKRIAYEIKVDRQDFLHELADPLKRRGALLLSNQYYFIAPVGLIRTNEVPIECGLIEVVGPGVKPEGGGWKNWWIARSPYWARETIDAPVRESVLPTWRFVASLSRRLMRIAENQHEADPVDAVPAMGGQPSPDHRRESSAPVCQGGLGMERVLPPQPSEDCQVRP